MAAVVSNPVPAMVRVVALIARLLVFKVTVGAATTLATCTGLPLLDPLVVTTAVKLPKDGAVLKVTTNRVGIAEVTVPVPLLSVTMLLPTVKSKPVPVMVSLVAVTDRLLVFMSTVGTETTFAVCPVKARLFKSTLALLEVEFAVTMSSLPSAFTSPKVTSYGKAPTAKVAGV